MKVTELFWGGTILVSLIGLSLHLYFICSSYLKYEFTESTHERRGEVRFPEISFCNMKGVSSTNFAAAAKNNSKIKAVFDHMNSAQDANEELYQSDYTSFVGEEDAPLMGHRLHDFVLRCQFDRKPCKDDDFVQFVFPPFVNCFTFVGQKDTEMKTRGEKDSGLTMSMYLEPDNISVASLYNPKAGSVYSGGVRILLSPPNQLKTIGHSAHEAAAGFSTSLVFDTTEHTRLPEPYNQCRHAVLPSLNTDIPYSFMECRNECIQKATIEECGCKNTHFMVRNRKNISSCADHLLSNKSISDTMMSCQVGVIHKTMGIPNYFSDECKCFWPCSDMTYSVAMSLSNWPTKSSMKYFLYNTIEKHSRKKDLKANHYYEFLKVSNASDDDIFFWVSHHFLRLNIYARSDMVVVKQEKPKYTVTDLLSCIGGSLGLWVGVSVLTFGKAFDYLVLVSGRTKKSDSGSVEDDK